MEHAKMNLLLFWTVFCPFIPLITQQNQNFEQRKKSLGDIIILNMCTINDNHMMSGNNPEEITIQ